MTLLMNWGKGDRDGNGRLSSADILSDLAQMLKSACTTYQLLCGSHVQTIVVGKVVWEAIREVTLNQEEYEVEPGIVLSRLALPPWYEINGVPVIHDPRQVPDDERALIVMAEN